MRKRGYLAGVFLAILCLVGFFYFFNQTVVYYINLLFTAKINRPEEVSEIMQDITRSYGLGFGVSSLVFVVLFFIGFKSSIKKSLKWLNVIGLLFSLSSLVLSSMLFFYPKDNFVIDSGSFFLIYYFLVLLIWIIGFILQRHFEKNQKTGSDDLIDFGF